MRDSRPVDQDRKANHICLFCGVTFLVFLVIGAGIIVYFYVDHLLSVPCIVTAIDETASPGKEFVATVLQRDCDLGASIDYSVHVQRRATPQSRGWIVTAPVESDVYPNRPARPTVRWNDSAVVEIIIPTNTLSGSYDRRLNGITITWKYVPLS